MTSPPRGSKTKHPIDAPQTRTGTILRHANTLSCSPAQTDDCIFLTRADGLVPLPQNVSGICFASIMFTFRASKESCVPDSWEGMNVYMKPWVIPLKGVSSYPIHRVRIFQNHHHQHVHLTSTPCTSLLHRHVLPRQNVGSRLVLSNRTYRTRNGGVGKRRA